ncbi:MAG: terminase large subunit [Aeriscardovia sp.]|nr:terminase large subunit [Aeriscardovia sp.]
MNNYILEYYQQIKDGSILVGKWVLMLYERIVHGIEDGTYKFDAKKADKAIKWIEKYCHHTEGVCAPGNLKLELWQKALVACIFGLINPKDGYRQFREVLLVVGRKNGKSLFASAIANYTFFEDGGFGTRVYCVAPKLDQADIIYNDIWTMITLEEDLLQNKELPKDNTARHRMTDLYIESTNSTVKKIAFSAKKSDGFNPSLTICDEIASWQGDAGLKQYEVMKSGMGARPEGIMLSCTTSGYQNDSIYDELVKRATRFLLGESKETKLLPFLYMIDDIEKWNDINELRKSNPNLGVSVSIDYLLEEIAIAEGSLSKKVEFITKYCCLKQNSSTAWLSTQTVQKCMGDEITLESLSKCYGVVGLDLSQTTDLTSACVVVEKNGILNVVSKFWLPAERIDEASDRDGVPYRLYIERGLLSPSGDNFVDYRDCYNWLVDLVEKYNILPLCIGYDRYSAQYLIQDLNAYGFKCDDVWQGENLWGVMQEAEGLMKDGKVCIGDNDLLKMHFLNSAVKMSTERGRGKLIKVSPTAHIDGMAAFLDAMTVRQKWWPEIGHQLKNER